MSQLIGSDLTEDEEFIIEKILKKRTENGCVEYLIKWKDFSDEDNTWERADTLEDNELVVEFERSQANKENNKSGLDNNELKDEVKVSVECDNTSDDKSDGSEGLNEKRIKSKENTKPKQRKRKKTLLSEPKGKKRGRDSSPVNRVVPKSGAKGFDRGLKADRVVGATEQNGKLMLLIKWKDFDCADLVPASLANVKCPQVVIAFYQKHLKFKPSDYLHLK